MYEAIVTSVRTRPHPNADRLQLGLAHGHQVVVGLDVPDNTLGVFFPSDGQLSHDFCVANDLYPVFDDEGNRIGGGFFSPKDRRVRAQAFRGERSEGYWCQMAALERFVEHMQDDKLAVAVAKLKEGDTFSELAGHVVCEKYYNRQTLQRMANKSTQARMQHPDFHKHVDTAQFKYNLGMIPKGSLITITEKLHGTSGRYGMLASKPPKPEGWFKQRVFRLACWTLSKFGVKPAKQYEMLAGSRNVVLDFKDKEHPEAQKALQKNFRYVIAQQLKGLLHPGEVIYGEIVGWEDVGRPVMGMHNPSKVSKQFAKRFGKEPFVYAYGCEEGTFRFVPYRIEQVREDGSRIELSHVQMVARCRQMGLEPVPLLWQRLCGYPEVAEAAVNEIHADLEQSRLDDHPSEGVVVRVDTPDGRTYWLKDKNFAFKVMEDIAKASDEIDLEEIS